MTEKARERVTARGRPSGIATTTTVIPIIKKLKISSKCSPVFHLFSNPLSTANLISITRTIEHAATNPNFPISSAILVSLIYSGVSSGSLYRSRADIFPTQELSPTTVIRSLPSPVKIFVPDIITQDGTSCLPAVFFDPSAINSSLLAIHCANTYFFIGSVSPVIADSSVVNSEASRTYPSAGISIPSINTTMSPTSTLD